VIRGVFVVTELHQGLRTSGVIARDGGGIQSNTLGGQGISVHAVMPQLVFDCPPHLIMTESGQHLSLAIIREVRVTDGMTQQLL
jgi:hypothetical protein